MFAGIDYAFRPSLETGWVYTGDTFRMLFCLALLAGTAGEVGRYWQASRETAVLDERRRIARDLHDGLAQELAFIVRRAKRTLEEEPRSAHAVQIANAAERALDESRRVIATLTRPLDEPLDVVLSEVVKGVADRIGATVALALDTGVHVAPDVREALVRIAREAVTNAARHGGTGLVRVELEQGPGLKLRIVDDGRGFDAINAKRRRNGGFGPGRLPHALRDAVEGRAAIPRRLVARLVAEFRDHGPRRRSIVSEAGHDLTSREWEVLDLLRKGLSTGQIAERLFVTRATVRSHVAAIVKKLQLPNRQALRMLDDGSLDP